MSEDQTLTRKCKHCGETKPRREFCKNRNGELGYKCRSCHKIFSTNRKAKKDRNTISKALVPLAADEAPVVVFKDSTETITAIRDSIGEMAQTLLKRCDYVRMTPQDLKMYVGALETANKILITNTLFLKQHVDASTMTDEELADLANSMLPTDLRTINVTAENDTKVRCAL